jgi:hypothetical protein
MAIMIAQILLMNQIVVVIDVLRVNGTVVMDNVFQHHMFVMDLLILVMQVGVQTVQMAQMKV